MKFKDVFEYRDGELYWKILHGRKNVKGAKAGFAWNDGYLGVGFNKKLYRIHRVIFEMHHGYCPKFIDHIDGNKQNNRIENLREATSNQNGYNTKLSSRNTTGVKGVSFDGKKYRVRFKVDGKAKSFGSYFDIDYAKFVSEAMRYKYHGNFANF
jgi:hypothetical protein